MPTLQEIRQKALDLGLSGEAAEVCVELELLRQRIPLRDGAILLQAQLLIVKLSKEARSHES